MKKTLIAAAMSAMALVSTSAFADFVPFSVDETVVPGTGANGFMFNANNMTGKYSELLGLTSLTTFSASAVGRITAYAVDGTPLSSALGVNEGIGGGMGYGLYALFVATGTATSSTTFVGTGGHLELWLDPSQNTTFNFNNDFTALATRSLSGDDIQIGSSDISFGTGDLVGPPGAFNIYFKDFALTAFGQTYWTGIDTMQFLLQTNGDIDGITPNPASNPPPYSLTGDFSANFAVPEPASVLLVGAGLIGAGLISRRRKSA